MIEHPLHKEIGEYLKKENISGIELILDPACGGDQNIPLFKNEIKSNATEYCNVDIMIIKNDRVKIIIEIEEANIKPTQICGKLLTSALSNYYSKKNSNKSIEMDDNTYFIQILDTTNLKEKSKKEEQFKNIEKSIQNILPVRNSRIRNYKIFGLKRGDDLTKIINEIKDIIK